MVDPEWKTRGSMAEIDKKLRVPLSCTETNWAMTRRFVFRIDSLLVGCHGIYERIRLLDRQEGGT